MTDDRGPADGADRPDRHGGATSSSSSPGDTSHEGASTTAGHEPDGARAVETTTPGPASTRATADPAPDVTEISFPELFENRQQYVGETVQVEVKSFFLASCPPPGPSGQTEPCVLSLHFTDPGRDDLTYGERDQALPGSEGGERVSCLEGSGPAGACPGWEHAVTYRIVAHVEHEVLGGRETESVQLDVGEKRRA